VFSDTKCAVDFVKCAVDFAGVCYVKQQNAKEISDGDDKLFAQYSWGSIVKDKLDCQISLFCFTVFTFLNTTG